MKKISTPHGKFPIYYGWNALARFAAEVGMTMNEVIVLNMMALEPIQLSEFILIGFKEGARKEETECKFKTIEEIGDMIDVMGLDLITQAMQAYTEMSFIKMALEEGEEDEEGEKKSP